MNKRLLMMKKMQPSSAGSPLLRRALSPDRLHPRSAEGKKVQLLTWGVPCCLINIKCCGGNLCLMLPPNQIYFLNNIFRWPQSRHCARRPASLLVVLANTGPPSIALHHPFHPGMNMNVVLENCLFLELFSSPNGWEVVQKKLASLPSH